LTVFRDSVFLFFCFPSFVSVRQARIASSNPRLHTKDFPCGFFPLDPLKRAFPQLHDVDELVMDKSPQFDSSCSLDIGFEANLVSPLPSICRRFFVDKFVFPEFTLSFLFILPGLFFSFQPTGFLPKRPRCPGGCFIPFLTFLKILWGWFRPPS